jgi:polysaccharide pyruvyl transferase WcaK-like protein
VGINVSGLLYSGKINFKLQCDYVELVHAILDWFIDDVGARVVLVPHVVTTVKMKKSKLALEFTDAMAISLLQEELDDAKRANVFALPEIDDPRQIKGVIGCCDYFIGSRMHACIGAISQSVPTTCLAYSDKFAGVMDLAGHENLVADLRTFQSGELMQRIQRSIDQLAEAKQRMLAVNETLNGRIEKFLHRDLGPVLVEGRI